jgi:Caspase domain/Putative peptidoglycan binding domain
MSRLVLSALALAMGLLCAPLWAEPALAGRRVALVIGNSAYQNAPFLPNPKKDAQAIAASFKKAGFDVVSALYDVGNLPFKRALRHFEDDATDADIAVVYYAGHGVEIHGTNYLVPVDAKLASDRDADDEAIPLDRLLESVEGAKRLRVIILDACRDNPFARKMKLQRTAAVRGISSGLAAVEPTGTNTLIAYAAKAGSQAEDGNGDHSPFATALMDNLFVAGLDIRLAFGRVRDEVLKKTSNRQEPFVYGSLGGANVALVPAPARPVARPVVAVDLEGEKTDFNLVDKIGTPRAWQVFLSQHPTGFYSDLAREKLRLASLEPPKPPKPAPPPGPSTEEQRAWDKIKDSSNAADFRAFIKRYPTSVLANVARLHAQAIEEEAKAKAEREAAEQRAEQERQALAEAKRQADEAARQRAEQEAALARAQQEAKAAEQARLNAEREAALKREEEERQSKLAETARAKQQADAEAAQKKAEQEAALQRAQEESKAAEEARLKAEREAEVKRQEEARQTALAEAARAKQDAACKIEQDRLASLQAAGRKARGDLKELEQGLTCERLRPLVVAALNRANALPDVNTPRQVRSAQQELARLGCFSGAADGSLNAPTKAAIRRYQSERGKSTGDVDLTDDFVSELKKQSARVCPLVCPTGKIAEGEQCVAAEKPKPVAHQKEVEKPAARRKAKIEEKRAHREQAKREQAKHEHAGREQAKHEHAKHEHARHERSRPEPRVIQQASRRGGYGGGGGGGGGGHGGGTTIGVGF